MKFKNNIINILAIFFGGIFFIPLMGIIIMGFIHFLEFCGLPIDITIGNTVISVVTNQVAFGPCFVLFLYLLGAFLVYSKLHLVKK